MKIKEGFKLRHLGGEYIVIGEGIAQVNFNKMISLNGTAAFIWEQMSGKSFTTDDITRLLSDNYEVEEAVAAADAATLVENWRKADLLDE